MKKAFDQTVRDLKRGVNKKVLKVPHIEQKILDATSNEPWGPHGSLLADIAQATRNHHEYQMIMNVIWKRINDTGKNWRHVYKGLTVLDYLVAHGSERVIDDIREHSYQIGTLADFQYIDSSGRDQGQNVRKKSQSLVSLVNNKERIQEVRQKAAANREKYRSSFSTGGGNRAGSYPGPGGYGDRYDDDRYGDQNGSGREREREYYRDEERYGRGGSDPYSRDGREYEENYNGRESSYRDRDDEYRGSRNSNSNYSDGYPYAGASRSRNSFDRDRDRPYDDDDRYSSRSAGGGRADDSHDDRRIERKLSEPNIATAASPPAPPSYEDAVRDSPVPFHEERDGENGTAAVAPKAESIPAPAAAPAPAPVPMSVPAPASAPVPAPASAAAPAQASVSEPLPTQTSTPVDGFDEFDPRGSFSAAPVGAPSASVPPPAGSVVNSLEMDLFGSDPIDSLALVPMSTTATIDDHSASINSGFEVNSFASMPTPAAASSPFEQVGSNPFGDAPFKAIPQDDNFSIPPTMPPVTATGASSFQTLSGEHTSVPAPAATPTSRMETVPSFSFGDAFGDMNFNPTPSGTGDVLGVAPFLASTATAAAGVPAVTGSAPAPFSQPQLAPTSTPFGMLQQNQFTPGGGVMQTNQFTAQAPIPGFSVPPQQGFLAPQAPTTTTAFVNPAVSFQAAQPQPATAFMNQIPGSSGGNLGMPSQPANQSTLFSFESSAPQAGVRPQSQPVFQSQSVPQSSGKFETKSSVWTDTLSRGLVNLNISGPKINPHADIGVDFDTMNRKEKREEKKSAAPAVVSTVTMGKAMGSGSGIGRVGVGGMAPPRNPMAGSGMGGMGIGMGMGAGMGMGMGVGMGMGMPMGGASNGGGYGGMNQPMGMGGMGGMGGSTGMGMGMGGGAQGMPMRPMGGMQPGAPGVGYNPMMGSGAGFGSQQQPYGGGGGFR